jgi:hypothetical protein
MTAFWVEDFTVLFRTLELIPKKGMSKEETFNAYTRLLLIATIVAVFLKYKYWYVIPVVGLAIIICMYYSLKKKNKTGGSYPNQDGEPQPMGYSIYTQTPRKPCPYPAPYHEPTQITTVPDLQWKPLSILKPYPAGYMQDYAAYNAPRDERMVPYPPMSAWDTWNAPDAKPKHNYYNQYQGLANCGNREKEIERVSTTALNLMADRFSECSVVRDYAQLQQATFFGSLLGKVPSCY